MNDEAKTPVKVVALKVCETCKHGVMRRTHADAFASQELECHAKPPVAMQYGEAVWPRVRVDDWCSGYAGRKK